MARTVLFALALSFAVSLHADDTPKKTEALDLSGIAVSPPNRAKHITRRYEEDRGNLMRAYPCNWSPARDTRFMTYFRSWQTALEGIDVSTLNEETKTELVALKARAVQAQKDWTIRASERAAVASLLPFASNIAGLEDAKRRAAAVDAPAVAAMLNQMKKDIAKAEETVESKATELKLSKSLMEVTSNQIVHLQGTLKAWYAFYNGYEPHVTWWCDVPVKEVDAALVKYYTKVKEATKSAPAGNKDGLKLVSIPTGMGPSDAPDVKAMLAEVPSEMIPVIERWQADRGGRRRGGAAPPANAKAEDKTATWLASLKTIPFEKLSRAGQVDYLLMKNQLESTARTAALRAKNGPPVLREPDASGIRGRPIGKEMVEEEFLSEMVPYTPEQLIELAEEEYQWCLSEMIKASKEMGYGEDWKKAVEKVKTLHMPAGKQPELVRDLAAEAISFVREKNVLTVPLICAETWRMSMISAERQLVSPFFLGGEVIQIAYPTLGMTHDAKMQSMRGNNKHFSKATVHHELIPGHGLQQYYNDRTNTYRAPFGTAFWTEGWAVYMEMVLYDNGFPKSPEDRVGMMFWRMHRCARVVFSLGFHTGKLSPQQCIDYLVEKVGHERANATAEVRRSFEGGYGPLYQCAYLIGATQFRALRKELVETGKMTQQQFHDAVMIGNRMPVEMVRAMLITDKLTPESLRVWKFWNAKP